MKAFFQGAARFLRGTLGRAFVVAVALAVLAYVGRSAGADKAEPPAPTTSSGLSSAGPPPVGARVVDASASSGSTHAAPAAPAAPTASPSQPTTRASPEAPVMLNTANADELRRLPGVGPKRAEAILNLRARLGRFRQVEDLLRVRGIGRGTLKRLRTLVRVDASPPAQVP